MLIYVIVFGALCSLIAAEAPLQTVKPMNVLSSSEPHTSFSFIRPGLTQTSFAFSGPSSHQSFSSSIGNPQLAQRVLPSLAQILAYRNPNLGYYPIASAGNGYGVTQAFATPTTGPLTYQANVDPTTLAYVQQLQQQQQHTYLHGYQPNAAYQAQLAQLLALKQTQAQTQQEQLQTIDSQQVVEQDNQLQQQEQPGRLSQNLLGVAYSSAPSVAHVKISGNGYKVDF